MKKITALAAMLCFFVLSMQAQYVLVPIAPPPSFTFNDLWHFTLMRSQDDKYVDFYVGMRIFDGNSLLKVKSNSTNFSLPTGNQYYNLSNINSLQPFTTSYYDAAILQQTISSGGQFPPNTYNVVYTLYGKAKDGEFTPLAEENIQVIVDVMWPPILLWPEDQSVLTDPNPALTWTPAFSSSFSGTITYDLKITEILSGQSKEQSIQANPSFFFSNSLPNTFYPYGIKEQQFEIDKKYAWQVTAHLGDVRANSQVWEFSFGQPSMLKISMQRPLYAPVLDKLDASYVFANSYRLRLKYTEEYEMTHRAFLLYNVYDDNGVKVASSLPPFNSASAALKKGDNYIELSLSTSGISLNNGRYYTLEVMNYKNEKKYLRFIIP